MPDFVEIHKGKCKGYFFAVVMSEENVVLFLEGEVGEGGEEFVDFYGGVVHVSGDGAFGARVD